MRKLAYITIVILTLTGCGKSSDSGSGNSTPPSPEKAILLFPSQNSLCTTGTNISDTQSIISLSWTPATNADSYEVDIKNLLTNTITVQMVSAAKLDITLPRATPFSWYVVSKSSKVQATVQSDTWKFYNAGVGIIYYPPFPADLSSPGYNTSVTATAGKINLTWVGSDADNNIIGYDVYLGTSSTAPALLKSNVTTMFLNDVAVTAGTTYYWKVVTKDAQGNSSQSNMYQFMVN